MFILNCINIVDRGYKIQTGFFSTNKNPFKSLSLYGINECDEETELKKNTFLGENSILIPFLFSKSAEESIHNHCSFGMKKKYFNSWTSAFENSYFLRN